MPLKKKKCADKDANTFSWDKLDVAQLNLLKLM